MPQIIQKKTQSSWNTFVCYLRFMTFNELRYMQVKIDRNFAVSRSIIMQIKLFTCQECSLRARFDKILSLRRMCVRVNVNRIKFKSNNSPVTNARIFIIPVINQLNLAYKWLVSVIDLWFNIIELCAKIIRRSAIYLMENSYRGVIGNIKS